MDLFITTPKDTSAVQPHPTEWQGLIKDLAKVFSCQLSTVEQILHTERRQLEQAAHIKDFIPVLAVKQVKELLRTSRHTPT